jgi:hypothetical protein
MNEMVDTLKERGGRYGDWRGQAQIAQNIKKAMQDSPNWSKLPAYMRETMDLIANKFARMLNGDWTYLDNWHDTVGYAKLAEDRLADDLKEPGKIVAPRMVDLNYLDVQGIFDYLIGARIGPIQFADYCKEHGMTVSQPTEEILRKIEEFNQDDGA